MQHEPFLRPGAMPPEEAAENSAVKRLSRKSGQRRATSVIKCHKAGRLEELGRRNGVIFGRHAWMDEGSNGMTRTRRKRPCRTPVARPSHQVMPKL